MAVLCGSTAGAQPVSVTFDAAALRSIGGEKQLARTKYFNHWGTHVIQGNTNLGNLANEVWAEDGLNSATGRETWEFDAFIAQNVPQDANRPGYFDRTALRQFLRNGSYNNFLNNNTRYESVRQHENHVLVQSGRQAAQWPGWIRNGTELPVAHGGAAYAEFLNTYLEEVVYGTGPQIGNSQSQAYLPVEPENFFIEIMNEPSWVLGPGGLDWDDVIEMHRTVTEQIKTHNPQAQIGGASVGNASFASWNPYRWEYKRRLMDDMVNWRTESGEKAEFDFWTFHPYDSRRINANGEVEHHIPESTGHLEGILDLFETYSHNLFGDPKRFAVTEYGTIQWSEFNGGDFSPYPRRLLQWDEMTDIKKKLFTFMDRPDRIINATPFVAPQWWTGSSPTEHGESGNVFWDRNPDGSWTETVMAGLYRMMNDVSGQYIGVDADNDEVQIVGFRDGQTLHIALNNLSESSQTLNLNALLGGAGVEQATLDRLFWNGATGVYQNNLDVLGDWQSLTLTGEEAAKLTLRLDGPLAYSIATDRSTYYGDDTQTPINLPGARSKVINIDADAEDAVSAAVRVAISGRQNIRSETFTIVVNGEPIVVPGRAANGFDEHDTHLFSREIEVPIELLNDGANEVYVDFGSSGGDLVTATLIVTRSLGDFNGSGEFDSGDVELLLDAFGQAAPGSKYDLTGDDGVVDIADVEYWLEELRGVEAGVLGDFNGDGVVVASDYTVWRDSAGTSSTSGFQGAGDSFAEVDVTDYRLWAGGFGGPGAGPANAQGVPEPGALLTAALAVFAAGLRRSPRCVHCG